MRASPAILLPALLLLACGPTKRAELPAPDPTATPAYASTTIELATLNREAVDAFHKGDGDKAAALIERGEPLSKTLMSVPHPTLAATQAASDLDQVYGDMLMSNRHYGWARLFYQKNRARWKYWLPPTEDSAARLKQAEQAMDECDRRIAHPK